MKINKSIHQASWFESILSKGSWYLLSSLLTKGLSFFLIPVYTRVLTTGEYGILEIIKSIVQLLPIIISFYIDSAFGRYFHEYKHDEKQLKRLFSTVYIFVLVNGILVLAVFFASSPIWMSSIVDIPLWPVTFIAFIPALLGQLSQLGLVFLRQNLDSKKTTIIEMGSAIANGGISVFLLLVINMNYEARLWGILAGITFTFFAYTIYFIKSGYLTLCFDRNIIKMCLIYSIPLIPNIAGGWINSFSDRIIISKYIDNSSVGLYSLAANIAFLLYLVQDAATQVQGPIAMSGLINDKEKTMRKIINFSLVMWGFMLFANWALLLFSPEILFLMADKKFHSAYKLVPIIGFIYVLSSQYRIFSSIISFHRMTWVISSGGIISAMLNLCSNLIFIPRFGYRAAAYTTVLSMLIYTIWIIFWALNKEKIKLSYLKYLLILIFYSVFVYMSSKFLIIEYFSMLNFLLKLSCFIVISILVIVLFKKKIFKRR